MTANLTAMSATSSANGVAREPSFDALDADFVAATLFDAPPRFTAAGLAARTASSFPDLGPIEALSAPEMEGAAVLSCAGAIAWVGLRDAPLRSAALDRAAALSRPDWPSAAEACGRARAHAVVRVAGAGPGDDPKAAQARALLTCCVGAALAALPGARAAIWLSGAFAAEPEAFRALALAELRRVGPPTRLVGLEIAAQTGAEGVRTCGLAPFIGNEVAFARPGVDLADAVALVRNAVAHAMSVGGPFDAAAADAALARTRPAATTRRAPPLIAEPPRRHVVASSPRPKRAPRPRSAQSGWFSRLLGR